MTTFEFTDRDLHVDARPCVPGLRAGGLRLAAGLHAIRIRRGAHAKVESPEGTVTIDSLDELGEALERV